MSMNQNSMAGNKSSVRQSAKNPCTINSSVNTLTPAPDRQRLNAGFFGDANNGNGYSSKSRTILFAAKRPKKCTTAIARSAYRKAT